MAGAEVVTNEERLRRIEAITDGALSGLDIAELLDELLERVRDLLKVDTATILLLGAHTGELVAAAAKGLEEEVRRGFRVRVGRGFAGRVAATRAPVTIYDVTPDDVVNPILLTTGVRALLGVPMLANGNLIGVLHVGSLTLRRFGPDDVRLLQLVADRASLAGQARAQILDRHYPPHLTCGETRSSFLPPTVHQVVNDGRTSGQAGSCYEEIRHRSSIRRAYPDRGLGSSPERSPAYA